jgi:hypothetical protein
MKFSSRFAACLLRPPQGICKEKQALIFDFPFASGAAMPIFQRENAKW